MKHISATVLAVLASTAVHAQDCTTDDAREKALIVFLEKHYGPVSVVAYPSDQGAGLLDLYFYPYEPRERDCEGRITDAKSGPLSTAGARARAFKCTD